MILRAVLDTNVVISALVFEGETNTLVVAWQQDRFLLLVSKIVLDEYIRVLHYPKFHLSRDEIRYLVEEEILPYIHPVKATKPSRSVSICRDPDDNMFLDCALAGHASFIVTGDKDLLALNPFRGIEILTPREFLSHLPSP